MSEFDEIENETGVLGEVEKDVKNVKDECCRKIKLIPLIFGCIVTAVVLVIVSWIGVKLVCKLKRNHEFRKHIDIDKCREAFNRARKMRRYYK